MRPEQRLALVPKMLQSIEILELATVDLLALIDRELEQNETLIAEPAERMEGLAQKEVESSSNSDDSTSWESGGLGWGSAARPSDEDGKQAFLNNVAGGQQSLLDYVQGQLGWLDLPAHLVDGVAFLAERLDGRGLLTETDAELLESLDRESLDSCRAILQTLEPRGIGARDPIEAMTLQIPESDPDLEDIRAMLTRHLDALAKNKLPDVAKSLGRTVTEVQALLERISHLDPRPGEQFAVETEQIAVYPDVIVRLIGGKIEVEVDSMSLPDLGVREDYRGLEASRDCERPVKAYLRSKLRSARDLIEAVAQRKRTLARVTLATMQHQKDFLVQGPSAVKSLSMSTVAEDLEVHPSTVSRAIAGIYAQTDHGIFRLRDFFDGDRRSAAPCADDKGRLAILDHIRELVAGESPEAPLSDDEIGHLLLQRNIKVARRTVAKYRGELGLQSSWRRRTHRE